MFETEDEEAIREDFSLSVVCVEKQVDIQTPRKHL